MRALAVDRMAEPIQHAAQQPRADVRAEAAAERRDARAGMQSVNVAERHEQHAALVEADDFGEHRLLFGQARDATELRQADVEAGGLDDESDDARHASEAREARQIADARGEAITKHRSAPCGGTRARARRRRGRRRCGRGLR